MNAIQTVHGTEHYDSVNDLAIITTYYNPCNYQSRYKNYLSFSEVILRSNLHLLTVECAFGSMPFQLRPGPNVLQIRCRDVMWQKERLLNMAIAQLPEKWTKVAWLDCDILFSEPDWAVRTSAVLDSHMFAQPYDHVIRLPKSAVTFTDQGDIMRSFASVYTDKSVIDREGWDNHGHTGYAWAARREFFEKCKLYDACILGNGDHLVAHGIVGEPDSSCILKRYKGSDPQYHHYLDWAERAYEVCRGDLDCVYGHVMHLWHGDPKNRRYLERQADLNNIGYNPFFDIGVASNGCLEWRTDRPDLHILPVRHFEHRQEDDLFREMDNLL